MLSLLSLLWPALVGADTLLVSPAWLSAHLGQPGLVLIHADRTRAPYDSGHIAGSRYLSLGSIVVERNGVPVELPAPATLDSVLESVGIGDSSRIVITGDRWRPDGSSSPWTTWAWAAGRRCSTAAPRRGWRRGSRSPRIRHRKRGASSPLTPGRISWPTPRGSRPTCATRPWRCSTRGPRPTTSARRAALHPSATFPARGTSSGRRPWADSRRVAPARDAGGDVPRGERAAGQAGGDLLPHGGAGQLSLFVAGYLGYDVKMYDGRSRSGASSPGERGDRRRRVAEGGASS